MKPGVVARRDAARAVGRILRSGAYSNRLVDTSRLPQPDADQFRFLTYTTLRHLKRVDEVIATYSNKPAGKLHGEVADVLRVAVAELLYGRAPAHAVVDSAVESIKSGKRSNAGGFVNGVLRAVLRDRDDAPRPSDPRSEYPDWIVEKLDAQWEADAVAAFLNASLGDAPRQVRSTSAEIGEGLPAVEGIPGAYEWTAGGDIPVGFVVQDAASVAVGNAVPLQPGDLVLDMAAAPGGKAAHLRDRGARVVASDRNRRRTADGRRRWQSISWVVADGLHPPFRPGAFDHVLLDAPCSGLGTMRRRPEVRYKADAKRVAEMAGRQRSMLDVALSLVRSGGTVTYSVCTITSDETIEVVADYTAGAPEGTPGVAWGKGILLGPHITDTDGMFISVVRRP